MKTPEEIKKGLWCCPGQYSGSCGRCPYSNDGGDCGRNGVQIMKDALAYIQQLEAKDANQAQRIAELEKELAAVKRERDAAVFALHGNCDECRWQDTAKCASCVYGIDAWNTHDDCWEWDGVCPENTEVQANE